MASEQSGASGTEPPQRPGESARPPPASAPMSVLGSRTTPTAFKLIVITLLVVVAAFVFVALRPKPDLGGPGKRAPDVGPAKASTAAASPSAP